MAFYFNFLTELDFEFCFNDNTFKMHVLCSSKVLLTDWKNVKSIKVVTWYAGSGITGLGSGSQTSGSGSTL